MNREIKFRFWDHEINKMSKSIGIGIIYETLNNYFRKATCNDNYIIDWAKIEIMQYTGLKDKNGVEIYEGDILKSGNGEGVSFVVWCLDGWRFNSWMPGDMRLYYHVDKTTGKEVAEIIGNIYEHSHLLK